MIFYIFIFLTIIFLVLFTIFLRYKEQIRFLETKLRVAEEEIDSLFNQNLLLLKNSCKKLDQLTEEDLFQDVNALQREGYSNIEFYKQLFSCQHHFEEEINYHVSFIPDEEATNLFEQLRIIHLECEASGDFYNDTATIYNELLQTFPARIVAKILKCDTKELYSYEEEEVFEILKEEKNAE